MRTIICKKCGTPIDADLGECPVCGAVYYVLPKEDGDSTRVWDTGAAAKAAEIRNAINKEDSLEETRPVPKPPKAVPPLEKQSQTRPAGKPSQHNQRPANPQGQTSESRQKPVQTQRKQTTTRPQPERRGANKNWIYVVVAVLLLAVLTTVMAIMSGAFNFGGSSKMPQLVGQTRDVAVNQLLAMGINPNIVYEESEESEGTVIAQDPAKGKSVKDSTTVTLTVSSGTAAETSEPEDYVEVPDVTGDRYEIAVARLEAADLEAEKGGEEQSDTVNEGDVISQSPLSGAKLKKGEKVSLIVSSGKEAGEFSVVLTAGKGGSISPVGSVTVKEGESLDILITPDEGYAIRELRIDGTSVGAPTEYTLYSIDAPHSVYAVFMAKDPPSAPPAESPAETQPASSTDIP